MILVSALFNTRKTFRSETIYSNAYLADDSLRQCLLKRISKKRKEICHIVTGNGSSMHTITESHAALLIKDGIKLTKTTGAHGLNIVVQHGHGQTMDSFTQTPID